MKIKSYLETQSRMSSAASPGLGQQGKDTGDFWKLLIAFPGPEEIVGSPGTAVSTNRVELTNSYLLLMLSKKSK